MKFRSVTAADTDAVVELWHVAGLGAGDEVDRAEVAERLLEDDSFFILSDTDDDQLQAVAMGCYDNHRGWVKRVAIHPSARGTGLGRALVDELERRFVAAGITQLRLAVWSQNEIGGAFWEALDYEELPDIRYFVKDLRT